jgi:hypothetical protein
VIAPVMSGPVRDSSGHPPVAAAGYRQPSYAMDTRIGSGIFR